MIQKFLHDPSNHISLSISFMRSFEIPHTVPDPSGAALDVLNESSASGLPSTNVSSFDSALAMSRLGNLTILLHNDCLM